MSWNSEPMWPLRAGSKADGWTRSTSDKSPVRESRTPGSVGEVPGNRHLYPTVGAQSVVNEPAEQSVDLVLQTRTEKGVKI